MVAANVAPANRPMTEKVDLTVNPSIMNREKPPFVIIAVKPRHKMLKGTPTFVRIKIR
jgi:hypothetical protein